MPQAQGSPPGVDPSIPSPARTQQMYLRSKAEVQRFFGGLELVAPYQGAAPAVVHMGLWGREDPELADSGGSRWGYAGVARRP